MSVYTNNKEVFFKPVKFTLTQCVNPDVRNIILHNILSHTCVCVLIYPGIVLVFHEETATSIADPPSRFHPAISVLFFIYIHNGVLRSRSNQQLTKPRKIGEEKAVQVGMVKEIAANCHHSNRVTERSRVKSRGCWVSSVVGPN